jgi:flavin-dependent dehydrogenase
MNHYDAIIVGGGPAGSAAATVLAEAGLSVILLEEKRMPRHKVCGEFITPECFPTLRRLGVFESIRTAGAQEITQLRLNDVNGRMLQVPIADISRDSTWAIGLSRYRFDQILLDRARAAGAVCLEGFAVKRSVSENGAICGVEGMSLIDGKMRVFQAPIVFDASGRNSRLTVSRDERVGGRHGRRLYALKAHLTGVTGIQDQVELYFFPEGYGGLSRVEDDFVNLCLIISERTLKESAGEGLKIVRRTVMKNKLARARLAQAEVSGKWLSAGPLTFGRRSLSENGVIPIGDAGGMIDPFTGTGMQIALRTGEMAAQSLIECVKPSAIADGPIHGSVEASEPYMQSGGWHRTLPEVLARYRSKYQQEFGKPMAVARMLRQAVFSPRSVELVGRILVRSPRLARRMLRATRVQKSS